MLDNLKVVIVVSGVGNTGKTCAVKRAMEKLSIVLNPKFPQRDNVLIGKVVMEHVPVLCGIASGGDSAEIVEENLSAFRNSDMDLQAIVIACKSDGGSRRAVEKFVQEVSFLPDWITTKWVADPKDRLHECERVSDEIIESLRRLIG